jgi:hypothetical protein
MAKRASVIWLDFNGVSRQTIITSTTGAGAIWAAVQAASQAQVEMSWESVLGASVGTPAAGNYQSAKMAAQLTYQTGSGAILRLTVPAPSLGIFLADGETVDPSTALVIAINTAAIGLLSDVSGNTAVTYVGGVLQPSRNDLPPIA